MCYNTENSEKEGAILSLAEEGVLLIKKPGVKTQNSLLRETETGEWDGFGKVFFRVSWSLCHGDRVVCAMRYFFRLRGARGGSW